MFKVGLTGGIASGKSTVANLFQIRGINIIDADVISKELVAPDTPCYQAIINLFGQDIVLSDRNLNRKQMREQIFSNPELKTKLESILHPAIQYEIINQSEASSSPYCVVVIPLLFESQMHNLVDRTLTVDIDTDTQLERLMNRDDIDASLAKKMISAQLSRKERNQLSDDLIYNRYSQHDLDAKVDILHQQYLNLAKIHLNSLPA